MKIRVLWVAFLITPVFPSSQAASETIERKPESLSAMSVTELAPVYRSDELSPSLRLARLEQNTSKIIPQLDAVARPSRTVFLRSSRQMLPAQPLAGPPPVVEASLAPERIVPPLEAATVSDVLDAENLVASLPKDRISEKTVEAEAVQGTILSDPLTLIISLKDQKLDVYRGAERVETTRVSSGMRGYDTLTGVFGILQKKQEHYSNLYAGAPMPFMQRLTRSGTALHAGHVPNYPASHGCVRMPSAFAPKLFRMTEIGGKVAMMTGKMVAPAPIEHPTLFEANSASVASPPAGSVAAGAKEAARAGAGIPADTAKASSDANAPLHILVTRREERDIAIGVQKILASMGYLAPQDKFVGYLGDGTKKAIKAFEKEHGLRQRGRFNEAIAAKIYEAAGLGPLPDAYLFLRKGFSRIGSVPVTIRDPRRNLGTHLFTYMRPSDGSEPQWVGISLEGDKSSKVLDRITIPDSMRGEISRSLTSGATFIVANVAKHSSVLPEGDDFIVRTNDSPESNSKPEKVVAKPRKKRVVEQTLVPARSLRARRKVHGPRGFGMFSRRHR